MQPPRHIFSHLFLFSSVWMIALSACHGELDRHPSIWTKPTEITNNVGEWRCPRPTSIDTGKWAGWYRDSKGVSLWNSVSGVGLASPENGCGITSLYCVDTKREA